MQVEVLLRYICLVASKVGSPSGKDEAGHFCPKPAVHLGANSYITG